MKNMMIRNQIEMFKREIVKLQGKNVDAEVRAELFESILRENSKLQMLYLEQIIALEKDLKEEEIKAQLVKDNNELIRFELASEKSINEDKIITSFAKKLREIVKDVKFVSDTRISERQAMTIFDGLRDRVGMTLDENQINFINKLNQKQASEIIRVLKAVSFLNQRQQITEVVKGMQDKPEFPEILAEVKKNIHKREWFEVNRDLLMASNELVPPTDAQIRMIATLANYIETHECFKLQFGLDISSYEVKVDGKNYYKFNRSLLSQHFKEEFSKEDAHNFLQTYEYLNNLHAPRMITQDQKMHLRKLYMQLGEIECTRPSFLNSISKDVYDALVARLENAVRTESIANYEGNKKFREDWAKHTTPRRARETRSIVATKEQDQAKELQAFVHMMYSIVGEQLGEDCQEFMPYFIQAGEVKYALVEEHHKATFRRWFLERKQIIMDLNRDFDFGAFVMGQPIHIIELIMGGLI